MKRNVNFLLILVLLSAMFSLLFPIVSSSEFLDYDLDSNKCVVYPSGEDDTSNLQEAFNTVASGGLGGEVQLLEGVYTISAPIIVENFDGWFHGAGKDKTLVENEYTESWPLPDDIFVHPGSPYLFRFYQTDDTVRTLRFSDMSIKVNGWSVEDPWKFKGMKVFNVHGKVDGDMENIYESEINTVFERIHFEGEITDFINVYNCLGCIFVSGETIPNILFKPLAGTHIIDNCTFYNVGGCIRYDTMTGHIVVTNNEFRNFSFFSMLPRNPSLPHLGTYFIYNNQFINSLSFDTMLFFGIDNSVIKNNNISGSLGGIVLSGSNHNLIQGNRITNSSSYGIKLEKSDDNIILNNYVKSNGTDLIWDGYGENIWMRNEFNTVNNTDIIDSNEAAIRNQGSQLEEINAEKEDLQHELESANIEISDLESSLEEATTSMSCLEDELSSVSSDIVELEDQVESLLEKVASRLTYSTAGIIAIIAAIIFGAVGFLAAKRM